MVSRAEVAEQSQSQSQSHSYHQHRGARTSVSRSSRSRHQQHHRGQSHAGGSSYVPQNDFPFFSQSGDVEILLTCDGHEKRYLLHSFTLAQWSGFFEASTSAEWAENSLVAAPLNGTTPGGPATRPGAAALSTVGEESSLLGSAVGNGNAEVNGTGGIAPGQISSSHPSNSTTLARRRWRYELDWANLSGEDDEPILVKRQPEGPLFRPSPGPLQQQPEPVTPRHHQSSGHSSWFRSVANLTILPHHRGAATQSSAHLASNNTTTSDPTLTVPLLRDYDNLFRCIYNRAPILNSNNIASAYSECKALLALADMYDALTVVGSRIDHHLLAFSSRLYKQIAKYPASYLKLGYLARSRAIFTEAVIHVVGQWPLASPYLRASEHSGGGYEVPVTVIHLIEDLVDELDELKAKVEMKLFRLTLTTSRGERVTPSNDYLGWLAMSLWRQWLAENTTPEVKGILKNTTTPGYRPGSGHSSHPSHSSTRPAHPPPPPPQHPPPPYYQHQHNATTTNNLPTQTHQSAPAPPPAPAPAPTAISTGRIFRIIASPNPSAFLSHEEIKRFLKIQPTSSSSSLYTRDNVRRFERKIDEIKNVARDIVKPLTRNCLELDLRTLSEAGSGAGTGGLGYLTCTRVEEADLPWIDD